VDRLKDSRNSQGGWVYFSGTEKMKVFLHNAPKTRIITSLVSIALGGAVIGVCSPIIASQVQFFYGMLQVFDKAGASTSISYSAGALIAAAAGGGLMVGAGVFGIAGHLARSQALLVVFLTLSIVGSLVATIGGGMFLSVPPMFGERIYFDDTNSITPPLKGVENDVNDFELALFNECCIPKNWTEQAQSLACTGNNNNDCPEIKDPLVLEYIPTAKVILCACASSNSSLTKYMEAMRDTQFCAKAQKATVNIAGIELPRKVPGNIKLQTIINRRYPGFQYSTVPLVGYQRPPQENPDQENARTNPLPFGCGLGYQKGIAWYMDLWFQQNALPSAYGALL